MNRIRIKGLTLAFTEGEYPGTPFQQARKVLEELLALEDALGLEITISQDIIPGQVSLFEDEEEIEDGQPAQWLIRSETERDDDSGEPLYWSNTDGWVSRETATVFTEEESKQDVRLVGEWRWERYRVEVAEEA